MRCVLHSGLLISLALGSASSPARCQPAEIDVLSSVALKAPLEALIPSFEASSGTSVHATFDSAGAVKRRIESGDKACVGILFTAAVEALAKQGRMIDPVGLAHIGVGLAYRRTEAKPAVGTIDAFKATLLAAKSIAVSDPALGGVSSSYYKTVVDRLGIGPTLAAKTILTKPGEGAKPVAAGRADIGIVTMSEVADLSNVNAVPLFPDDPKTQAAFSAGLSATCPQAARAKAFVAFLRTPQAATVFRSKNINPD